MFERAEESALLLRMMREAAEVLGARWDKVPERQRPHYPPEQRFAGPRGLEAVGTGRPNAKNPARSSRGSGSTADRVCSRGR